MMTWHAGSCIAPSRRAVRIAVLVPVICLLVEALAAAQVYPIKKSPNGRYLVDQNNVPFLIAGDAPQSLTVNLSTTDADSFCSNRKSHHFNSLWVNLVCTTYTAGRADGSTYDGLLPFTGFLPGAPSDLDHYDVTKPNEAFFARVDQMITIAAKYGIQVFLDPMETGGWLNCMVNNGPANCRTYGRYLGNRYKSFPNIVWQSGNDYQAWSTSTNDAAVTSVALGIKDNDPTHLQTIELNYTVSNSTDDPNWVPIISLDASYTYNSTYAEVLKAYNLSNVLPVFLVEANYEEESLQGYLTTPYICRKQEYWTNLSGATGQLFGNHFTWTFASGWQNHLDTPGAVQMAYLQALFTARAWYTLVPDQSHAVLTAGYGTFDANGSDQTNDFAPAARTADGTLVVAYLPTHRTVTIDLTKLSGSVTARWYDPSAGTYSSISGSPFPNSGSLTFTPPGANTAGDPDWVLVLEATAGTPTPPSITVQPASQTVTAGQTATFSVSATGTSPLSYQWEKNGSAISGATSASYTTPPTSAADSGSTFRVTVSNSAGSAASSSATLTVTPSGGSVLSINSGGGASGSFVPDTDFSGGNTYATTTAVATTGVTNPAPVAVYQSERWGAFTYAVGGLAAGSSYTVRLHFAEIWWSATGQRVFNVAINGKTVLSNFDIVEAAGGSFRALVKEFPATADSGGKVTIAYTQGSADWPKSSGVEIVAGSSATSPTITTQPIGQTVSVGQSASFSVAASGTAPLSYQWQKNGTMISGATGPSYVTPAASAADNGSTFRVIVSNSVGSVTSTSATLTVTSSGTLPPTAAAYAFDEGSGTTTRDSSGNGNTGTLVNSPAWTSGKYGSALGFGTSSYVTIPNSSTLNISGTAFSVSFFANITNAGGDQVLIDKPWDSTSYPVPYYQYGVEFGSSSGTFDLFLGDASGGVHKHSMAGPLGVWTHIAFTFDGSTVKGYVNGSLALSVADSFSMVARGNPLRIGLDHTGGQPTLGKLDNIRVYARTLSQTDVENDLATPIAGSTGSTSLSINSGGGATGSFRSDTDFTGGNTYATTTAVATSGVTSAAPAAVYQSERWGAFTYSVGGLLPGATYTVRLHFAEIWWSGTGQRIFNVGINGTPVLSNFDIVAAAGGSFKALVKSFTATADSTGKVTISYTQGSVDWPKSSGVEVIGP